MLIIILAVFSVARSLPGLDSVSEVLGQHRQTVHVKDHSNQGLPTLPTKRPDWYMI